MSALARRAVLVLGRDEPSERLQLLEQERLEVGVGAVLLELAREPARDGDVRAELELKALARLHEPAAQERVDADRLPPLARLPADDPVGLEDEVALGAVERGVDQEPRLVLLLVLLRRALRLGRDRELVRLAERLRRAVRQHLPPRAGCSRCTTGGGCPSARRARSRRPRSSSSPTRTPLFGRKCSTSSGCVAPKKLSQYAHLNLNVALSASLTGVELVGGERERRALERRVAEVRRAPCASSIAPLSSSSGGGSGRRTRIIGAGCPSLRLLPDLRDLASSSTPSARAARRGRPARRPRDVVVGGLVDDPLAPRRPEHVEAVEPRRELAQPSPLRAARPCGFALRR